MFLYIPGISDYFQTLEILEKTLSDKEKTYVTRVCPNWHQVSTLRTRNPLMLDDACVVSCGLIESGSIP